MKIFFSWSKRIVWYHSPHFNAANTGRCVSTCTVYSNIPGLGTINVTSGADCIVKHTRLFPFMLF